MSTELQTTEDKNEPAFLGIPKIQVNGANVSGEHQFEAWKEATAPVHHIESVHDPKDYTAGSTVWLLKKLLVARSHFSPTRYIRDNKHIGSGTNDFMLLQLFLSGSEKIQMGSEEHLVTPGNIILRDWAHEFKTESSRCEVVCVAIPRELIISSNEIYEKSPFISWSSDTAAGRVLSSSIRSLLNELPTAAQEDATTMSSGFLGMLNGMLSSRPTTKFMNHINSALGASMKAFLLENIEKPRLGVRSICEAFNCSRATVYRNFEEEGGVVKYIRSEKIKRAFHVLAQADPEKVSPQQIASRFGFSDYNVFRTSFKEIIEMEPEEALFLKSTSDAGGKILSISDLPNEVKTFSSWLKSL